MPVFSKYVEEFDGEMRTQAAISIDNLWERMKGEFLNEWTTLNRQGLSPEEMERQLLDFLGDLSTGFEQDIARQSTGVAVSEGRDMAIKSAAEAGDVEFAVRSEILDEATCPPCELLDGTVYEIGSAEYDENMPPAKCDGGARCRGIMIAVPKEMMQ